MRSLMWRHRWLSALVIPVAVAVVGCVPSLEDNEAREPRTELPKAFGDAEAETAALAAWRQMFADPHLRALIETALTNNQELNIRFQEIIIAKNESRASKAEYQPKVGVGARAGVEKPGKYTSQGQSDEAHGVPENLPGLRAGFTATWEIDVWGKLRNAAKAAIRRYLATIEGKRFAETQIVAEIANSYYELMALDNQLKVLNRNIEIQEKALELVRVEKEAARTTELAVQRFQAEVLRNQSRRFAIEQSIVEAENRINYLVGRFPQKVARDSDGFAKLKPTAIGSGIPSQLLENRPDIRQAKLLLQAAKLDVKVAKARFYPSFSIDADVGYEAFNANHFADTPDSIFYNLAGNMTAPLLNRAGIEADYKSANAAQIQAVFNYERAILGAFTEVSNELAKVKNLGKGYDLQKEQVDTLKKASDVSRILFRSARADYVEVLLTRREALEAEMELIETKLSQMKTMVNLYQALGGGWRSNVDEDIVLPEDDEEDVKDDDE